MNAAIGKITCPITGALSDVCRAKSGKYPYYYRNDRAGIIHGRAEGFQRWLHENATFDTPQVNPYAPSEPAAQKPEPASEPSEPEKKSDGDNWLKGLGL